VSHEPWDRFGKGGDACGDARVRGVLACSILACNAANDVWTRWVAQHTSSRHTSCHPTRHTTRHTSHHTLHITPHVTLSHRSTLRSWPSSA
jgi:hypothetical protein